VGSRLEQHSVKDRLELSRLQRVNAVVGGEERGDERDAQIGNRQIREEQL
jgi:hypothetical protein